MSSFDPEFGEMLLASERAINEHFRGISGVHAALGGLAIVGGIVLGSGMDTAHPVSINPVEIVGASIIGLAATGAGVKRGLPINSACKEIIKYRSMPRVAWETIHASGNYPQDTTPKRDVVPGVRPVRSAIANTLTTICDGATSSLLVVAAKNGHLMPLTFEHKEIAAAAVTGTVGITHHAVEGLRTKWQRRQARQQLAMAANVVNWEYDRIITETRQNRRHR